MIRATITHATDLADYYAQLCAAQAKAHGPDYLLHHDVIRQAARDGCTSYAELGVNQGATLACALLAGFQYVVGVDTRPELLEPFTGLFQGALRLHQDSRNALPLGVDFLLVDAVHTAAHVREELRVHGPNVGRTILIHDTWAVPALHVEAVTWALRHGWTVQSREARSVGFTVLTRTP